MTEYYIPRKEHSNLFFLKFALFFLMTLNFFNQDIFKSFVSDSSVMKCNHRSFLMATAFVLKTYLCNYHVNRSSTGESRFLMLYSEEMSTGKTTSLQILAYGQGVNDENEYSRSILSCGNGYTVGTTTKPLKEVFQSTNLFIYLNDYVPNTTIDELLLQAHEGFGHGSGSSSGIKKSLASILLTSNKVETKRLLGRVVRIQYSCSNEVSPQDLAKYHDFTKWNKGFLISCCHHFSSVWFEDEVVSKIGQIDELLRKYNPSAQSRITKAWASTIMAYVLMMYSTKMIVDMKEILQFALNALRSDGKTYNAISSIHALEDNIMYELQSNPAEMMSKELKLIYGTHCSNVTIHNFAETVDGKSVLKSKKAFGKEYSVLNEHIEESFEITQLEMEELDIGLPAIKTLVNNVISRKLRIPYISNEKSFLKKLSPGSKRCYLQGSPEYRRSLEMIYNTGYRNGHDDGKKANMENVNG